MPERKKYAPAFFILSRFYTSLLRTKVSEQSSFPSTSQEVLKYCRESTKVLPRKYWSTAKEVLTHLQSVQ